MTLTDMVAVLSNTLPGNYGSYHGDDNGFQEYCNDLEELYKAQEQLKKLVDGLVMYEWHDLRKNPENLPEDFGVYQICIDAKFANVHETDYETCVYDPGHKGEWILNSTDQPLWSAYNKHVCTIVAWRVIEPCEGAK